jgi:transmembrane sensor
MALSFSVEELLLDETFLDYCSNNNSIHKNKWEEIIAAHPALLQTIEAARDLYFLLHPGLPPEEIRREMDKAREMIFFGNKEHQPLLSADVNPGEDLYVNHAGELKRKSYKKILVYSLAAISLSSGLLFLTVKGLKNNSPEKKLQQMMVYRNENAVRKQVLLPDSSLVILNSNSSVSVPADYNQTNRLVQLSGAAFFKVRKNAARPFIVSTPAFSTTALGTSFYVRAAGEQNNYSVELLEGRVKLSASKGVSQPAYLDPGEEGQWRKSAAAFTKQMFDTSELRQWLDGRLLFHHTPAQQVIKRLEKWYAVEIEVRKKNWGKLAVTGDYINVPLDDVLKLVCFSLSCQYSYSGNKIIIQ